VHSIGSYCANISQCTVHKTFEAFLCLNRKIFIINFVFMLHKFLLEKKLRTL